jgi:hypothetical protein
VTLPPKAAGARSGDTNGRRERRHTGTTATFLPATSTSTLPPFLTSYRLCTPLTNTQDENTSANLKIESHHRYGKRKDLARPRSSRYSTTFSTKASHITCKFILIHLVTLVVGVVSRCEAFFLSAGRTTYQHINTTAIAATPLSSRPCNSRPYLGPYTSAQNRARRGSISAMGHGCAAQRRDAEPRPVCLMHFAMRYPFQLAYGRGYV